MPFSFHVLMSLTAQHDPQRGCMMGVLQGSSPGIWWWQKQWQIYHQAWERGSQPGTMKTTLKLSPGIFLCLFLMSQNLLASEGFMIAPIIEWFSVKIRMLLTKILFGKKWQLTARFFFPTSHTAITTTRALNKTRGHPCRYLGKITPGLLQIATSQAGNSPKHPTSGLANKSTETAFSYVSLLKFGVNGTEHSNLLKGWNNSVLWIERAKLH